MKRRVRAEPGSGHVELKNQKWWVRRTVVGPNGERRRWREGPYVSEDDAEAACATVTLRFTAATPIGEWLDGWVEQEAKRALLGQREDHARQVRTDVNHVKPYLYNVRIGDVNPSDWMDVWDELLTVLSEKTGKPLSRKTVGNIKTTLSGAMKATMSDRLLDSNPVRDAPLPMLHRGKEDSVGQLCTNRSTISAYPEGWLRDPTLEVAALQPGRPPHADRGRRAPPGAAPNRCACDQRSCDAQKRNVWNPDEFARR